MGRSSLPGEVDEVELTVPHDLLAVGHALLDHDLQREDRVASGRVFVHEGLGRLALLYAPLQDAEDVLGREHLYFFQTAADHA